MTTKITEKNVSNLANAGLQWQSVQTSGFTAAAGLGYFCNTTSAAFTVTLPSSATRGDTIALKDYAGTFATNKLTIDRNGHNIQGVANNSSISTNRASVVLVYVDTTRGWEFTIESNVANLGQTLFISATGGTILTDGNFKTHVFTGDGSFVVATVGNAPTVPAGGPQNVDYLVVAGGGQSGCGGGGGAGGYRTTFPSPGCNAGSFPVTVTTYPITVGAGGGGKGSDSLFSTITSTGGGRGQPYAGCAGASVSGGSGGGGAGFPGGNRSAGSGNTPPVSPPQGNPGGSHGPGPQITGGGGGGAATSGSNSPGPNTGGVGGVGSPISTTFFGPTSPSYGTSGPAPGRYFAGGGGGTAHTGSPPSTTSGGSGGGGTGSSVPGSSTEGTINTGGGGGANLAGGLNGGKGIVVIRYKFQ
jgi:hypothetical protein